MELTTIIWLVVGGILLIMFSVSVKKWISIYNDLQYWKTRAERTLASVDAVMQQRLDNLHALARIAEKYDSHEYTALKDVIEARSRWSKDMDLNQKVKAVENNYLKVQAVFERYPNLKADRMYTTLMKTDSGIERRLLKIRLRYNWVGQQYNVRTRQFPKNIVAQTHTFPKLEYFAFENQEVFDPNGIFNKQDQESQVA